MPLSGGTFVVGQFNGTVEGRDLASGAVLWTFTTEAARRNAGWVLAADGSFATSLMYHSSWLEDPVAGMEKEYSVGSFLASPTIADGVAYVGSTDGKLYAIE